MSKKKHSENEPEMLDEYDFSGGVRGKYTARLAAIVKRYDAGELSQGKAAEIADLTRAEFINALADFKVSVIQYTAEELADELKDAS
jgi:predicted HTH domain antitoxin